MKMILYFLRHGLAGDRAAWSKDDRLRPLTQKGIDQLKASMPVISTLVPDLDLIITSPLVRARQTAEIAVRHLGMEKSLVEDERLAPGFGIDEASLIVDENPAAEGLMFVGHEPDFSLTISALIGGGRLICKKGGIARIDLASLSPLQGELIWLIPPKVLAG
jgi:phosphohistidine phosphatase